MKDKIKYYRDLWTMIKKLHRGERIIAGFDVQSVECKGVTNTNFYKIRTSVEYPMTLVVEEVKRRKPKAGIVFK